MCSITNEIWLFNGIDYFTCREQELYELNSAGKKAPRFSFFVIKARLKWQSVPPTPTFISKSVLFWVWMKFAWLAPCVIRSV